MTIEQAAIAYLFDRIPALRDLPMRGIERIEAEEAVRNAIADAIEAHMLDYEDDLIDAIEDGLDAEYEHANA